MKLTLRSLVLAGAGLCLGLAAGCSSDDKPREDETTMDLRYIAQAYHTIQTASDRPPREMAQIQQVLTEFHASGLNGKPEDVLTSTRDGQPYEIVLGVDLRSQNTNEIFVYERQGKDGVRYVMTVAREVLKLSDAEFAAASLAAGKKPE